MVGTMVSRRVLCLKTSQLKKNWTDKRNSAVAWHLWPLSRSRLTLDNAVYCLMFPPKCFLHHHHCQFVRSLPCAIPSSWPSALAISSDPISSGPDPISSAELFDFPPWLPSHIALVGFNCSQHVTHPSVSITKLDLLKVKFFVYSIGSSSVPRSVPWSHSGFSESLLSQWMNVSNDTWTLGNSSVLQVSYLLLIPNNDKYIPASFTLSCSPCNPPHLQGINFQTLSA